MSWTDWQEIEREDIDIEEDDSEVIRTGKVLIDYILEDKRDDIGDEPSDDFVQGWVEAIDQMGTELEKELGTENLARLAHRLWTHWSQHIAEEEDISQDRYERWEKLWVPFDDLSEEMKDKDRELVERFLDEKPDYRNNPEGGNQS